jgi:hypothetical protein
VLIAPHGRTLEAAFALCGVIHSITPERRKCV